MASDAPIKTAATPKFESFVEQQLAQVRQRLRAIDVGAAALLLLAITLTYAVLMSIFDLVVGATDAPWTVNVRLGLFVVYVAAMGVGFWILGARLMRRINPYYAAQQLEQTLPGAKNSVINWLDLKGENLPAAIRSSLGQRAAKDLKQADADKVVDPRKSWLLGGLAIAMVVALVIIFAVSPSQFGSMLARAFVPFRDIGLASRTTINLIRPAGDVTVAQNQPVAFLAEIAGRFPKVNHPQAPTLWYRYGPGDPFVPVPLEEDGNGQWAVTMAADQVRTGFWYKLTAGDAETPIYQASIRSLPAATRFDVTYRYRPYRKIAEETVSFPNEHAVFPDLRGHRGTEVTLIVYTNQPVREGRLQVEFGKTLKEVPGERLPDNPKAYRCRFALETSGQYRVLFKTQDEESNTDRSAYRIDVLDDLPPGVVLTRPGKDSEIAANGTLTLEGHAHDDFGVKGLALHLRVFEGAQKPTLAAKPYRPGKKFEFDAGTYPAKIDYQDFVALDQVKTEQGAAFPLTAGMVLEYWLEATDNADYPSATGNVGRSAVYKLKILEPQKDSKKQQEDRKQAEDQKNKHEKQQDQQHTKQNEEKKQDGSNQGKSPEQQKADDLKNKLDETANKLKDKIDQQDKQKNQGESKGDDPAKAENKDSGGDKSPEADQKDSKGAKNEQTAGSKKDDGDQGDGPKSGAAKTQGDKPQPPSPDKQQAGDAKGPGDQKSPPSAAKGDESQGNDGGSDNQPMNAKAGPKENPKEQPGQGKDQGDQGGMDKAAQGKDNGPKDQDKDQPGAGAKGSQGEKDAPPQAKNDKQAPKDSQGGKKGDSKPGSNDKLAKEKGQGNAKPDASVSKNPPGADGTRKPADAKGDEENARKSDAKTSTGKGQDPKEGPTAQAKDQPQRPDGSPKGDSKDAPPDQAQDAAMAKNDKGQGPPREPTQKDLDRLKEQLKQNDPKGVKEAKEELERNLPETKDPQVRKAAEELLKEAAKQQEAMAKNQEPKDQNPKNTDAKNTGPDSEKGPGDKTGEPMTTKADGDKPGPASNQDKGSQKNKPGAQSDGGVKPGGSGATGQNADDNLKPGDVNQDFANRAGNLQLEDLKSRVTPEMRKLAGVSDEEWQQFLKDAQAYEDLRRKMQNQPKKEIDRKRGQDSKLTNVGPRQVLGQTNNADPASIGQPHAPPELREAQRRFTLPKNR